MGYHLKVVEAIEFLFAERHHRDVGDLVQRNGSLARLSLPHKVNTNQVDRERERREKEKK